MPRCPSCTNEIDHLNYSQSATEYGVVEWVGGNLQHDTEETQTNGELFYSCPRCGQNFNNSTEVENFLGGEGTVQARENRQNRSPTIHYSPIPKEDLSKLIGKPFDEAKKVKGEDDANFIQTLQDNDLWFCAECGKVGKETSFVPSKENDLTCKECIKKQK